MKILFIIMSLLYQEKVSPAFAAKVIEIADKLSVNPNWIMATINFESAGTFSPSIPEGQYGKCVGLIQFCPDRGKDYKTIGNKIYYIADLAKMTAVQQLDVVYEYYNQYKAKLVSFQDLYLATLFPIAMNKPADFVLQGGGISASAIARSNRSFDTTGKGYITVGDVRDTLFTKTVPPAYVASFRQSADTLTKYTSRNWLGIATVSLVIVSVVYYLIINKKAILK